MKQIDLTTIILTYNEEIHIRRCLENVCTFSKKVIVVDSPSTDRTQEICGEFDNVEVVEHKYPGNQAAQFNWAIDNLQIDTEWILRIDADEYLFPELIEELGDVFADEEKLKGVNAFSMPRARAFMGKRLKHGIVKSVRLVRLFRKGKARYEDKEMDEQLIVLEGDTRDLKCEFIDDNRMPLRAWIDKHNDYAEREVRDYFLTLTSTVTSTVTSTSAQGGSLSGGVQEKRDKKMGYYRLPIFWRAIGYFFYRYIVKLGFLDGKEGFMWDFFQGLWYRLLVDAKIWEREHAERLEERG